jgi:tRNA-dihydrouridine synthase A
MVGREAYRNPWILAEAGAALFGRPISTRGDIVRQMVPYITDQVGRGHRLGSITKHMLGLYSGQPGARRWRRTLTEGAAGNAMDASMVLAAIPDAVA